MHEADEKNDEAEGKKLLRMRKNWEKKKKMRNKKLNEKTINMALPDMRKIVGKAEYLVEWALIWKQEKVLNCDELISAFKKTKKYKDKNIYFIL